MGRVYTVVFSNVTVAAAQDLFQINGAAGKMLRIISANLADIDPTAPATNQQLGIRFRFLPATVTNGSGGTTPTPQKTDNGDAAASFTALVNNTTPATTSGTAAVVVADGSNVYAGYNYNFPSRPTVGPSQAFTMELITTPASSLKLSGTIWVEEFGG